MKINTLTKAAKLLADIRELDEQIIAIDKIAMLGVDTNKKNTLSITVEKAKEKKAKIDTSEFDLGQSMYQGILGMYKIPTDKSKKDSVDFDIDEIETMIICGSLIQIKKDKRKLLVTQLLELGYTY